MCRKGGNAYVFDGLIRKILFGKGDIGRNVFKKRLKGERELEAQLVEDIHIALDGLPQRNQPLVPGGGQLLLLFPALIYYGNRDPAEAESPVYYFTAQHIVQVCHSIE